MDFALAGCRFAHFTAMTMLFGAILYIRVYAPAGVRRELAGRFSPLPPRFAPIAPSSALGWFAFVARAMTGEEGLDAASALDVAAETAFGRLWCWRVPLLVGLTALCAWGRAFSGCGLALTAAALGALALTGHAAMQEGLLGAAHRGNDALHLLLVAAWIGGLLPFAACLTLARGHDGRPDAIAAMMRFSLAGHAVTPLIFVTGAANVAMTAGAIPWPLDTPYRALLAGKILVFAAMTALALFNRYFLVPRLRCSSCAGTALLGATLVEFLLSLVAVTAVSFFALLDPN